ncbi:MULTISPECIES: sensor histidine kinase [Janibacter]|uniref:Sensor-like histidine kinase SenX3 n=1 Tax=Janibacter hoylei PVAS-1 TaxID=1210046 RepID=K1E6V2_9MICO|nr:ATP-binding protein [Janibacter hoylei]EKA61167.1 histidine kinase [Janibacter hoylei PVAS-1]MCT1620486.1 ATP-binding protein [Janibacter hoylei]MCT2293909.1 ATP-binding protein [Janibacter hoylei]MCW4602046.1 ATP-binding protein [Janibacter hoylei]RWU82705.1 two-component sensor histidine kinase [Janibacter hoylei PVAS-1]
MQPTTAAILGGVAGLLIGFLVWAAITMSDRERAAAPEPEPEVPHGVGDVLAVLRSSGVVVDRAGRVITTSPAAVTYGLVRHGQLVHPEIASMVEQVARDGVIREAQLELARPGLSTLVYVSARVAPLGAKNLLLLVDDQTHGRRVEETRRDFVANVSHELKTPVGGISLLAEAVMDAKDDPQAVDRFARRMQGEAVRLSSLIKEIVELSRLQGTPVLQDPELVEIEDVVALALDHLRLEAEAKQITLTDKVAADLYVRGDEDMLITAVRNLVGNAISYADAGTAVGVGARLQGDTVEIAVTDQGPGIPEHEQTRIFERFYRMDAARSRATGGTGLGLSIVKHICANHGGDIQVWSDGDHGSTFTIRLPAAAETLQADTPHSPTTTPKESR